MKVGTLCAETRDGSPPHPLCFQRPRASRTCEAGRRPLSSMVARKGLRINDCKRARRTRWLANGPFLDAVCVCLSPRRRLSSGQLLSTWRWHHLGAAGPVHSPLVRRWPALVAAGAVVAAGASRCGDYLERGAHHPTETAMAPRSATGEAASALGADRRVVHLEVVIEG